jgi:hypothetical protein
MGKHFDELSKALASGQSRRQALRRFGVGVAATLVASLMPSQTAEAKLEADAHHLFTAKCLKICAEEYSPRSPRFGRCVSACVRCRLKGGLFVNVNDGLICIDD